MKTIAHMNFTQLDNFQQAVEGYINDNLSFIKENADASDPATMAQASLNHYNASVEAAEQNDEVLSDEQKEAFLATAKRLFESGFFV